MQTIEHHRFSSRANAGRQLAKRLANFARLPSVIILAMPRGSVCVAAKIAKALNKPLDVLLIRRLILPNSDDVSFGAITSGGIRMLNYAMIDRMHLENQVIADIVLREAIEPTRRERLYRGDRPSLEIADHQVILVDDGLTPSSLIRDAIRLLRRQHPEKVVLALPAAPAQAKRDLEMEADQVVIVSEFDLSTPLGDGFRNFAPTTDADVFGLLGRAATAGTGPQTRLRRLRATAYVTEEGTRDGNHTFHEFTQTLSSC